MSFIDDYKRILQTTLQAGNIDAARQLVNNFHGTAQGYDAQLCYLEAALCYYEARYPLALFWADRGYQLDSDYQPLHELLGFLTDPDQDFSAYTPSYPFDCSLMNRQLRIVVFEGVLEIMDYTAEQFRTSFEALGHKVHIFHTETPEESTRQLLEFVADGIDFSLIINSSGLIFKMKDGQNLWDILGVPCFDLLFDHPFYFFQNYDQAPAACVTLCMDQNHVNYIKRFYPNVPHAFFLPLGSEEYPTPEVIPWQERSIDVLYVGSLKEIDPSKQDFFSQKVMDYLVTHTDITTEAAIEICFQNLTDTEADTILAKLEIEPVQSGNPSVTAVTTINDQLLKKVLEKYRYCDTNTNSIFRKEMIKQLLDAHIHVHVYGNGWTASGFMENPYFHFGGFVTQTECLQKMQDSKIVLNSMPWFKNGAHDRIFNAMLAHAVCVTDSSIYLKEQFTDGKELVFYHLDDMSELPFLIKNILSDPDRAGMIAENGYQSAVLHHTWQNRAIELLTRVFTKNYD